MEESDRLRLGEDAARGSRASEILNNQSWQAAEEAVEAEIFRAWKQSEPTDHEGREALFHQLNSFRMMQRALRAFIETGKFAAMALQQAEDGPGSGPTEPSPSG